MSALAQDFITFIMSKQGQDIITEEGYISEAESPAEYTQPVSYTHLIGEEPGTWTMTDGRLVLILPTDGGITLDESEYEGEKSYINLEDNDIQFIKQYDKAKEVYDEIVAAEEEQRRLEEEQAQKEKEEKIQFLVDNVPGRYDFADYDWMVSEDDIIYVRLNDDGTYFISCDSYDGGLTEEGTYTIDTGDLNTTYSGKEFLTIQFTSEKESPNLAEYKKGDYEDGEPSMKDVEAVSYTHLDVYKRQYRGKWRRRFLSVPGG